MKLKNIFWHRSRILLQQHGALYRRRTERIAAKYIAPYVAFLLKNSSKLNLPAYSTTPQLNASKRIKNTLEKTVFCLQQTK